MRVCYFGTYYDWYSQNRILIEGLKENGVEVIECNTKIETLSKYIDLIKKHSALNDYDMMILGFPGYGVMPLAKLLTRKPVVLDAFLSWYYSVVFDKQIIRKNSIAAKRLYYEEKIALSLANMALLDTNTHIDWFSHFFNIEKTKFKRVFIGANNKYFYPHEAHKTEDEFIVLFWGSFYRLQGIGYIIKAAKLLEDYKDIRFKIIGHGHMFDEIKRLSEQLNTNNISFLGYIDYEKLPEHIAESDVCLGIFGDTEKATWVIPNKAFEALAMEKPLITGDSPAAREALTDKENCLLCRMGDEHSLAKSILLLKEDKALRRKIAKNGYGLFKERFTPKAIGKNLKNILIKVLNEQ